VTLSPASMFLRLRLANGREAKLFVIPSLLRALFEMGSRIFECLSSIPSMDIFFPPPSRFSLHHTIVTLIQNIVEHGIS
jgi:hypothetical protein